MHVADVTDVADVADVTDVTGAGESENLETAKVTAETENCSSPP